MRPTLAFALCAALLTAPRAEAASLAGSWTVTTEGARGTTDDGSQWSLGAITGALTLAQKGNDITGSWKGQMPAPWALTGQLNDREFVLQTEWRDIPAMRDGVQSIARARWIFRGTLSGDTATGTMMLELGERWGRPVAAVQGKARTVESQQSGVRPASMYVIIKQVSLARRWLQPSFNPLVATS